MQSITVDPLLVPKASLLLSQYSGVLCRQDMMERTIDFVVYCHRKFTAVNVIFALEMIGAFRSSTPPSAHLLKISLREEKVRDGNLTIRERGRSA
jgi:hypothetical protein